MLLGEPPRTQGDLNFSCFGIPVRVHPFFWLIAVLLGPWRAPPGQSVVIPLLIWTVAFFVSILFHELGHAIAMRAYGFHPWIALYGLGGVTSRDAAQFGRSKGSEPLGQVLISFAGPGAGFLLAAILSGAIVLSGHEIMVLVGFPYGIMVAPAEMIGSLHLTRLIGYLLVINILWGLVNLLPVYPLDGGQITREIFVAINPREGIRQSLGLSIFTGIAMAVIGLILWKSLWVALLFGYLAYMSYATLQAYTKRRPW